MVRTKSCQHIAMESPDLNPMENVLAKVVKSVHEYRAPRNREELWGSIQKAWADLDMNHTQTLINLMNNRLIDLINKDGSATR